MFSSLKKTQYETSLLFEKLISENSFPPVSIFSGPPFSGRMYAASLISSALGSDGSSTVILSDRDSFRIISAAAELFRINRTRRAALFLKRNLSVFLCGYNGAMLDTGSSSVKKKFAQAGDLSDLAGMLPDVPENEIEGFCSKVIKTVNDITGSRASAPVSVNQIRNIKEWCSTSSIQNKRKTVIIEGLENALSSSPNALLKILEEVPDNTTFILLTQNASGIPATILSRSRIFNFRALDKDALSFVFDSISVNPSDFKDMESFIYKYSGTDETLLEKCALDLINTGKTDIKALGAELENSKSYDRFYYLVLKNISASADPDKDDFEKKLYLYNEIKTAVSKAEVFNQNKRLLLDYVIYRTGEFVR